MKYPRTYHLPWSQGVSKDDLRLQSVDCFEGKNLVITEKLDGECTAFNRSGIHARSEEGYNRHWQTWLKGRWAQIAYLIPEELEIFGENLYAVHSIEYQLLREYFHVFAVVNKKTNCFLAWKEVAIVAQRLGFPVVPIINFFSGQLTELPIPQKSAYGNTCEGYVVRNIDSFSVTEFQSNVAKCVRKGHIQTDKNWTRNWRKAELIKI